MKRFSPRCTQAHANKNWRSWDRTEAQKAEFLRMQFDAQHRYYHEH